MKKCKNCLVERPLVAFYKHAEMLDGHLNVCKTCVKIRVRKHREVNIDKIRDYDRKRGNRQPEDYSKKYYKENKKKVLESKMRWIKKNNIKINAQQKARRALSMGLIKKAELCQRCFKNSEKLQGHHDDYNKPLSVLWLCSKCHGLRHKELNELKRNGLNSMSYIYENKFINS